MISILFNWRTILALVAITIVTGSIVYSNYLSEKLGKQETDRVETWVEAQRTMLKTTDPANIGLASMLISENSEIPIIETDEKDSIISHRNLDSLRAVKDKDYVRNKFQEFKQLHAPIVLVISDTPFIANRYYYGESALQKEVRYYPTIQLVIVGLFIIITVVALRTRYRSRQNQLWAGMAKETAHQLGTPLTSLQGWIEMLKEDNANRKVALEMEKDINRLQLVSDRFGKIGSHPKLEEKNIITLLLQMVDYVKMRAGKHVEFETEFHGKQEICAMVSPPLFDWVIENLLKNSLDAMEGRGKMKIEVVEKASKIYIDVTDSGKGISKASINKIFNPGYTTKKRGWGLGLTLTKRIIEQYHNGNIFVKWSEMGKGTTFRIILDKSAV